jgi:hypothetical protein
MSSGKPARFAVVLSCSGLQPHEILVPTRDEQDAYEMRDRYHAGTAVEVQG